VSEVIRYQTPVIHMRRTRPATPELGGKAIKQGDKVVMWYVSGNRDEGAIDEPERFVVGRPRARLHLAFGAGIHRCVGDRLAEMPAKDPVGGDPEAQSCARDRGSAGALYSNFIRGIRSLPVVIRT